MTQPKVSVLVPVYNAEKYLAACLNSIVGQTYSNLQVVLLDDGSTDGSLDICQSYADRYEYVEIHHQANQGVATARNALLSKVKGDYTIFIDSDDWIEPEMIADLVGYIQEYELDIAICASISERNDSNTVVDKMRQVPLIENREQIIIKFLLHKELNGSLWNKLVKTSLFHKLVFDPTIWYGEDALMMWQVLQRANRVGTVKTQYYHYRMNDASISHQSFGAKKMSGHKVWETIYKDTCKLWPEYKGIAKAQYAISDMWLMFYAALDLYPFDENIRFYQRHIRRQILSILRASNITNNKKIFAIGMALNYRLGGCVIRKMI